MQASSSIYSCLLDSRQTRFNFERAAETYDAHAAMQLEIGTKLLNRLPAIQPGGVLDMGCGTGAMSRLLRQHYQHAEVVAADLALGMVRKACEQPATPGKPLGVCTDAARLPFQTRGFDLLLSNLMLQWCNDLPAVFGEFARVLKPDALLSFSTFGPATLREMRASWREVDGFPHVSRFLGTDDLENALRRAGFHALDVRVETMIIRYAEVGSLLRELKGIGAANTAIDRHHGLTGKGRMQRFLKAYETHRLADGGYPATYEAIYVHALAPAG